jgi:hypothetical protein
MKLQKLNILLLLIAGFVGLGGCEEPTQRSYYHSEYESSNYYRSSDPSSDFYNPTGDPAYSYDPVYSPIQRAPDYKPGTPAYHYSYYYSKTNGD